MAAAAAMPRLGSDPSGRKFADLSPDSAAALRLVEGIKEEMMVVMLDVLQVAAQACARVCVQRMQEQRNMLVHYVEEAETHKAPSAGNTRTPTPTTAAAINLKRKTSFYELFEEPHPDDAASAPAAGAVAAAAAQADAPGAQVTRIASSGEEAVRPEDDNLEEMYDDLDKSVAKLRAALAARRKELQDCGVYESDDEDVFDLHAALHHDPAAGGASSGVGSASTGLAGAADLLPASLRDGADHRPPRLPSKRQSESGSLNQSADQPADPSADQVGSPNQSAADPPADQEKLGRDGPEGRGDGGYPQPK